MPKSDVKENYNFSISLPTTERTHCWSEKSKQEEQVKQSAKIKIILDDDAKEDARPY